MSEQGSGRVPVFQQIQEMKWNFWIANIIEAFERLAFFGVRAVLPIYMISTDAGGIGLSYTQKGTIYGIWALIQCLLPMVSGGYTDAYGYRKSMYVAFTLNIIGYCLMAHADGFWLMLAAACFVGTGTAIFKPPVQGSVAKSLNEGNSGLGFGIFYWMVNVGGLLAPVIFSALRGTDLKPTWDYVFYGAAIVTVFNFLPATFLFREPKLDPEARKKKPAEVFSDTLLTLWRDKPMLRFLLVVSGFWFMFMQLWDLLPNFIDEWVDTRDVTTTLIADYEFPDAAATAEVDAAADEAGAEAATPEAPAPAAVVGDDDSAGGDDDSAVAAGDDDSAKGDDDSAAVSARGPPEEPAAPAAAEADAEESQGFSADNWVLSDGRFKPEMLINIDAAMIIIFVFLASWFFGKYRMIISLMLGMVIAVAGFVGAGISQAGIFVGAMIAVFAIGEIICSPKFTEYVGMTAPPDKKAIYLGYSNIPFAIGWAVGNWVSGPLYDAFSSKEMLARRYLVEHLGMSQEKADALEPEVVFGTLMTEMGVTDPFEATNVLWQTYNPWIIWPMLGSVGVISIIGMWMNYRQSQKNPPPAAPAPATAPAGEGEGDQPRWKEVDGDGE